MGKDAVAVTNGVLYSYVLGVESVQVASKSVVSALDAAGLLVTPAMERAVEACKRYANWCVGEWHVASGAEAVLQAGRALLAEEAERAPKPKWVARLTVGGGWRVDNGVPCPEPPQNVYKEVAGTVGNLTESQARAVAEALNREARP